LSKEGIRGAMPIGAEAGYGDGVVGVAEVDGNQNL